MELLLKRIFKGDEYTIGNLYIDGIKFCDTLEDVDRSLTQDMNIEDIKNIKKKDVTAIPTGRYEITLSVQSPKFSKYTQYEFCKGYLPRLIGVPGFDGILIHIGNYAADTSGCILVGLNTKKGMLTNSTDTFKNLYSKLKESSDKNENIYITIE